MNKDMFRSVELLRKTPSVNVPLVVGLSPKTAIMNSVSGACSGGACGACACACRGVVYRENANAMPVIDDRKR